ncbi:F-box protein At3g49450-like [Telopea speciosissima]|uniref:F-box protein At3g49450-like n=1 Tax=Telopea speciosissima TaxID=54955 RepID=UPI001CC7FAAB|nr:F-box protein At3g49450-like [Telopea speciosissima]
MINILSRLTVKALSRFKCVSKQWNMLISDPYFVSSHQARAAQDPNILKVLWVDHRDGSIGVCSIREKEERIVTVDLIRPNYPDAFLLQGGVIMEGRPCNGLICLAAGYADDSLVCNPATGNTMVIQRGNKRKYTYVQGLGYCSSRNEFKVVRLCDRLELDKNIPENNHWYGCEIFTVGQKGAQGTNLPLHSLSWRYVGDLPL